MDFRITGLPVEPFIPFFSMSDAELLTPRRPPRRRESRGCAADAALPRQPARFRTG